MALTAFQQAVSNLARSMGLKGAAEQRVYSTPEYQRLYQQFFPGPPIEVGQGQQAAEQDLTMQLLQGLQERFAQPAPDLDLSSFQTQLADINKLLTGPISLPSLSEADLANLAAIKAANDAQIADQQGILQGKLTADLFGRGVQNSTIAGDAAAQFAKAMGLIQTQSNADAATRMLSLQQALGQLRQGNLALAGQNALGAGNMAVAGFTSENDALATLLNQMIQALGNQNQTQLGRASLGETQRQNLQDTGERARQFDAQMEAQKGSIWKTIAGMAATLGAAAIPGVGPFIAPAVGSIFSKGGGGFNAGGKMSSLGGGIKGIDF